MFFPIDHWFSDTFPQVRSSAIRFIFFSQFCFKLNPKKQQIDIRDCKNKVKMSSLFTYRPHDEWIHISVNNVKKINFIGSFKKQMQSKNLLSNTGTLWPVFANICHCEWLRNFLFLFDNENSSKQEQVFHNNRYFMSALGFNIKTCAQNGNFTTMSQNWQINVFQLM